MSRTYQLVCHDCKVRLWIGQGNPNREYIYTTEEALRLLQDFFFGHQRHRIEFGDDEFMGLWNYHRLDADTEVEAGRRRPKGK